MLKLHIWYSESLLYGLLELKGTSRLFTWNDFDSRVKGGGLYNAVKRQDAAARGLLRGVSRCRAGALLHTHADGFQM